LKICRKVFQFEKGCGKMSTVRYGSKGEDVRRLQTILGIDADGIFGKQTRKAVKEFQKRYGLFVDGIVGEKTWQKLLEIEDADAVNPDKITYEPVDWVQPVDYKQYDKRWSAIPYTSTGNRNQTIGSSGCGPTAMADVLATLVSPQITPVSIARYFVQCGFRTSNQGTSWAAFPWAAKKYGLAFEQTTSIETAKKYLRNGGYVVCSMKEGYWTSGGHYICAWKYDDVYMYANDPASVKRTKQNLKDFDAQCKRYFCFIRRGD